MSHLNNLIPDCMICWKMTSYLFVYGRMLHPLLLISFLMMMFCFGKDLCCIQTKSVPALFFVCFKSFMVQMKTLAILFSPDHTFKNRIVVVIFNTHDVSRQKQPCRPTVSEFVPARSIVILVSSVRLANILTFNSLAVSSGFLPSAKELTGK